jgi:hypothetical protein
MQSKAPLLYNKDFYEWSRSWMGFEKDIEVGDKILQEYIPFITDFRDTGNMHSPRLIYHIPHSMEA